MHVYVVFVCNIMLNFARTFTARVNYGKNNNSPLCEPRVSETEDKTPITILYPLAHVTRETARQSQRVLSKTNACNTNVYTV